MHGLPRNRKSKTCTICWLKSVLHEEKRRTGSDSGAGAQMQQKTCRMSPDIGAEEENHVRRGPTDRKWLTVLSTLYSITILMCTVVHLCWFNRLCRLL